MENYNTITVPTNLYFALDNNLRNALVVLLSLSNRLSNKDGFFFRTNTDLQEDFKFGKNLTIAVIESLYQYGLLEVRTTHRQTNYYRINVEKFKEFEKENIYTITKNEELHLKTVDYKKKGFKVTYNTGNTPTIVSNLPSGETPSQALEKGLERQETQNPEITDTKPQSTQEELDEISEMWLELQKEKAKLEKAVIETPSKVEIRSFPKFDDSVKQRCKELVTRYVEMVIPSSNESLDK